MPSSVIFRGRDLSQSIVAGPDRREKEDTEKTLGTTDGYSRTRRDPEYDTQQTLRGDDNIILIYYRGTIKTLNVVNYENALAVAGVLHILYRKIKS